MKILWALLLGALAVPGACVSAGEDGDVVIAKRGTAAITFSELDARMLEIDADKRAGFLDSPERIDKLVNDLLALEQLANEAREANLDKRDDVRAMMALAEKRLLSAMWLQALRARAAKLDTAALAKETYLAEPSRFKTEEKLVLRHILIKASEGCDPEAETRAKHIREEALKGDKSFAELASTYSEDVVSRKEGGLIPEVVRGRSVKEFEDAAFALQKPGEISPVVKTQFGYHIIQLQSRMAPEQRPFESVRGEIEARLEAEARLRTQKEYTDNLQNLPIDAVPEVVASLRERYDSAGNVTKPYRGSAGQRESK